MVKWGQRTEEAILLAIVLLNVFDFLKWLPDHLIFIQNIISWVTLGYLIGRAGLTEIFFGTKRLHVDLLLITSYFLLVVKNLVAVAQAEIGESQNLGGFYAFVLQHAIAFEYGSFLAGGILLLAFSIYMAFRVEIRHPSILAMIHEEGLPESWPDLFGRALSIFLVAAAFFIIVFNLVFEWLAMAVDAPLVMLGIFIYLFAVIRHHKKLDPEGLIYRFGSFGEGFYKKFIQLFHYPQTILLGLIGMLVLHLLTDISVFMIPYIFGIRDVLYFSQFGAGHSALPALFLNDIKGQGAIAVLSLFFLYLLNLTAMLFFLLLPAFIWFKLFSSKPLHVSRFVLGPVLGSLLAFLITPAFAIRRLTAGGLVGVDIQTKSILEGRNWLDNFMAHPTAIWVVTLAALTITLVIVFLEMERPTSRSVFLLAAIAGTVFLGYYVAYYFASVYAFYATAIGALWDAKQLFIVFYFILFAAILAVFYLAGFFGFMYEVIKNHLYYRSIEE